MVHNLLYGSLSWGILWMALLLGSCKDSVEESGFDDAYARVPQSVVMQLNVALFAPTRDVPDCEKVKELRVILLDEKTKNVEFNELMDVENYSVPEDSRFLYEYKKEGIMTTVGKKILYALANSEELIQDIVTLPGAEMITELDSLKLTDGTGNFPFSKHGKVPIASRKEHITLSVDNGMEDFITRVTHVYLTKVTVELAYVPVKFSLSYENGDNAVPMEVLEWKIDQLAKTSYLVPRMNDSEWDKLVNLAGTTDAQEWVRNYEVPAESGFHGYSHVYEKPIAIKYDDGQPKADENTYYLHETKFLGNVKRDDVQKDDAQENNVQEYYLTLKIRKTEEGADQNPVSVSAKLPNLESLVRGTHVVIKARIRQWPEPGDNSLDVRVTTWIDDKPVDGGWEEVTPGGI